MGKKKQEERQKETVLRSVRCLLTDEEKLRLGQALAKEHGELDTANERATEVKAQLKATIEAHEAQVKKLSRVLANGYEYRDVECEIDRDFETKSVGVIRLDTGEEVERRPMSAAELQRELNL